MRAAEMKIKTFMMAAGMSALMAGFAPAEAEMSDAVAAARFVENFSARTVDVLYDTEEASEQRDRRLREIFSEAFDMEAMAKAVVDRSWGEIAPEKREQYYELFGTYLLNNSIQLLNRYEPNEFEVVKTQKIADDKAVVTTRVTRLGFSIATIDWVVQKSETGYRVMDVVMDKVSTVRTYRSEFRSVIQRRGVGGLLAALRAKAAL